MLEPWRLEAEPCAAFRMGTVCSLWLAVLQRFTEAGVHKQAQTPACLRATWNR